MYHVNTVVRDDGAEPFGAADHADLSDFYRRRRDLAPTPLRRLPCFARALGVRELHVKDESSRFGLNAFKSLGVRYALDRLLRSAQGSRIDQHATLVCASAGNHGRAVARAARELGMPARVYMSSATREAQRRAIASEGAQVIVIDGTYEEAVAAMAADAETSGWVIVSDTSWPGYEEIPNLIMLGYTRLVTEVHEQLGGAPDVIFAQAGVGGLVCGVAAGIVHEWPDRRPRLVSCEPTGAACLLASARAGKPVVLEGPINSIMSGLGCSAPSPAAWRILADRVDAFVAVDDTQAMAAMRMLAHPMSKDPAIVAGPSGACSFASLVAVMRDDAMRPVREALGLGPASRVVAINTEGATDPELYERILTCC